LIENEANLHLKIKVTLIFPNKLIIYINFCSLIHLKLEEGIDETPLEVATRYIFK